MNSTTAVKDPVCGMDVESATAAGRTEHKGGPITSAVQSVKRNSTSVRSDTWTSLQERRGAATVAAARSKDTDTFCAGGLGE